MYVNEFVRANVETGDVLRSSLFSFCFSDRNCGCAKETATSWASHASQVHFATDGEIESACENGDDSNCDQSDASNGEIMEKVCRDVHLGSDNERFLRHRFFPKPKVIATQNSLPKRNHAAKEAVSAALQTSTRQRSERRTKPSDTPTTKPRPCVKTMLADTELDLRIFVLYYMSTPRKEYDGVSGNHLG